MKYFRVNIQFTTDKQYWHDNLKENIRAEDHKKAIIGVLDKWGFEVMKGKKPICNTYIDDKDGNSKISGYIYRVKTQIDSKQVYFDAWTDVSELVEVEYDIIEDNR